MKWMINGIPGFQQPEESHIRKGKYKNVQKNVQKKKKCWDLRVVIGEEKMYFIQICLENPMQSETVYCHS